MVLQSLQVLVRQVVLLVDSTKLSNTFSETNKMGEQKKEKYVLYLVNAILVKHIKSILILYG